MERTITYTIPPDSDGLRIRQFLQRKGYSASNLGTLKLTPDGILVNGLHQFLTYPLTEGEELTVHFIETESSEKIPPVPIPLDLVYEDEDLLVVNKPARMPIHPSMKNYTNTMANGLAWYFAEQGIPFVFRCSNRLDRDTSGLTVVAKHAISGNHLSTMMARREIHREYLAIVAGAVTPPSGRIDAPLGRKPGSVIERTVDWENGERAVTHYELVQPLQGHSLIRLRLETGRTHQIRIHMKYLGYPLIGDYLYHPDMTWISRQALHSAKLSFTHPITGEPMCFEAPLPEDMQHAVDELSL